MQSTRSNKQFSKPTDIIEMVTSATDAPRDRRFYEQDKLLIKFLDKYKFRLRGDQLVQVDSKTGISSKLQSLLAALKSAILRRLHDAGEDKIDNWVAVARKQSKSKRPIGDLNNYVILLKEPNAFEVAASFLELEEIQFARPLFKPPPPQSPRQVIRLFPMSRYGTR